MAEVGSYGQPSCATCGGRGVFEVGSDHKTAQCVPCSSERRQRAVAAFGFSLECRGCDAVLTVEDHGGRKSRPTTWRLFGPLCGHCLTATPRAGSERESA